MNKHNKRVIDIENKQAVSREEKGGRRRIMCEGD